MAALILAFVGAVGVAAGIHLFMQHHQAKNGVVVTGTIVEVTSENWTTTDDDGIRRTSTTYKPTIEYTDAHGNVHHLTPNLSGGTRPEVGDTRQVAYRPDDPARAVLVAVGSERAAKWMFLILGLAALVGAIVLAVS